MSMQAVTLNEKKYGIRLWNTLKSPAALRVFIYTLCLTFSLFSILTFNDLKSPSSSQRPSNHGYMVYSYKLGSIIATASCTVYSMTVPGQREAISRSWNGARPFCMCRNMRWRWYSSLNGEQNGSRPITIAYTTIPLRTQPITTLYQHCTGLIR